MAKQLPWYNINIFGFQLLSHFESDHLFTFNCATMLHQHSTTFTFPHLKNSKHLFIIQHIVIPFSFTFKSPSLHKYVSPTSLSVPTKFLILPLLVKCSYKLHSVFKILSKSHMLGIFLISIVSGVYYINYDSILSKSLNNPNLYINGLTCGTLIIKIKNSICACLIVSRVFIYASNKPLCSTLIINLGKNSICACYCKQIKTSFARIK